MYIVSMFTSAPAHQRLPWRSSVSAVGMRQWTWRALNHTNYTPHDSTGPPSSSLLSLHTPLSPPSPPLHPPSSPHLHTPLSPPSPPLPPPSSPHLHTPLSPPSSPQFLHTPLSPPSPPLAQPSSPPLPPFLPHTEGSTSPGG